MYRPRKLQKTKIQKELPKQQELCEFYVPIEKKKHNVFIETGKSSKEFKINIIQCFINDEELLREEFYFVLNRSGSLSIQFKFPLRPIAKGIGKFSLFGKTFYLIKPKISTLNVSVLFQRKY